MGRMQFVQRNLSDVVTLTLHDKHLEYARTADGERGVTVHYGDLPAPFDHCQYTEPADAFLNGVVFAVAAGSLPSLYRTGNFDVALAVAGVLLMAGLTAVAMATHRLLKKPYTALLAGERLLLVQDSQHAAILAELETRRIQALRADSAIDPLAPPRAELARAKWMRDNGVLDDGEFAVAERALLAAIAAEHQAPQGNFSYELN